MGALLAVEHRWSLLLAVIYAAVVVVAVVAWLLVGDAWWNQLVNLTAFWWLVPSLPLLVLALGFRRWTAAAVLLVPVAALAWGYAGLFVGSSPAAASADALKVAAYNMWFRTDGVAHVVELVTEQQPDLLLVSEVTDQHAAALRSELGDQLAHSWFGEPDFVGGVGVLSRHPIIDVRTIEDSQDFERPTAVVVIGVAHGGEVQPVQVVPVHLVAACPVCGPFGDRQRLEIESRQREMRAILRALDDEMPAIVGGDYNGNRWTQPYRMLAAGGFVDPHRAVGFGLGLTYPSDHAPAALRGSLRSGPVAHIPFVSFPVLRLDQVLVRGLTPVSANVGAARASDHLPVIVELSW